MTINSRNGNTLLESGFFPPCRLATTGSNVALAGLAAIDGVTPNAGDRILVKDQADATTNGIYAAASGPWVRVTDAASNSQFFDGMGVVVALGAANAGLIFFCTCVDDPVVIGTSLLTFASQQALANALQIATSTTSAALTQGTKTFATQSGKAFAAKQWVLIYETANPDNTLLAEITSYSGTALVVSVVATGGSGGPFTDWTIVLTNTPAAAGRQPPTGTGNASGPGSAVDGNVPLFDGATGKLLKDSGKALGTLASRATLLFGDGGVKAIGAASLADGAAPLAFCAPQPSDNLTLLNDVTNPNTDLRIGAGRVRDDADLTNLQLAATMLKRIDTAWAAGGNVGNRQGMLLSSSSWLANQTYHIWLIGNLGQAVTQRSRTSNVATLTVTAHGLGVGGTYRAIGVGGGYDGVGAITAVATNTISYANTGSNEGATAVSGATLDGFDIGATQQGIQGYPGANLPTGWTVKQGLGSILTDGSKNVIQFFQYGDEFWLGTPILDVNAVGLSSSLATPVLHTPVGVKVQAIMNVLFTRAGLGGGLYIYPPDITAQALSGSVAPLGTLYGNIGLTAGSVNELDLMAQVRCWTNTSAAVAIFGSGAVTVYVALVGFRDPRRRLF